MEKKYCPLCQCESRIFKSYKKKQYFRCDNCSGIFLNPQMNPCKNAEKIRYEKHNNNIHDNHYRNFVAPVCKKVLHDFSTRHHGLDFGAGTGPVISAILQEKKYQIEQYDPFFHYYPHLLEKKYDYVICCEVIEHFHYPNKEFYLLQRLLNPKGKLYCMTDLYSEETDFDNWYYKNDFTHVFFYHKHTLEWIKNNMGFSDVSINNRLVEFSI